jgi:cobalt-zinc-cadmium efflux system membrane fusion protein
VNVMMKRRSHSPRGARPATATSGFALALTLALSVCLGPGLTAGCGRGAAPASDTRKDTDRPDADDHENDAAKKPAAASKAGKNARAGNSDRAAEKPDADKADAGSEGAHAEEGEHHDDEGGAVELSEEAMKRADIEVAEVRAVDASSVLLAPANLEPNADKLARVGPRVSGRIARVAVSLGATVKAGQALATIRSPEAAEAAAALDSAKAAENLARASLARERDLFERKISARREVLEAEAAAASAQAAVRAAEARLAAMGFARGAGSTGSAASSPAGAAAGNRNADAGASLDPVVTVTSPIAGTVIERTAAADAPVQPDSVLFTIADLRSLWLTVKVPELNATQIRRGQRVQIDVRALPGAPITGAIDYVAPIVDAGTRTVDVRLSVPNPQGMLRPGMSATAKFELTATAPPSASPASRASSASPANAAASGSPRPAASSARILIPRAAVQELNQASVVFVATDEERRFEPKPVTLGATYGPDVEILSGLTAGTRIVVRGAFTLKAQAVRGGAAHDH